MESPFARSVHGYLPQDVELLAGTVAQNIARFETEPESAAVIAAAQAASVHELILRLPNGYETEIGERRRTVSRTASRDRARACAVRRSVPAGARRAELQPRLRGR